MSVMASPDRPDEGHIADTGMFQRFVAQEQEMEQREVTKSGPRWVLPGVAALLAVVIIVVILLLVL
jgi:hypothetical protein